MFVNVTHASESFHAGHFRVTHRGAHLLELAYLAGALAMFGALVCLNRFARIMALTPYLIGGALMWVLMLKSGIHATIAGVLLVQRGRLRDELT